MNRLPEASDELFAVAAAHPQYGFTHSDVQALPGYTAHCRGESPEWRELPAVSNVATEFSRQPIKAEETLVRRIYAAKTTNSVKLYSRVGFGGRYGKMESRGTFTGTCLHTPLVLMLISRYCTLLSALAKMP